EQDIALMRLVARLVQSLWAEGRRLKPVEIVAEFEKTIIDELDLMREGASASQLRRNFSQSDLLYVPEVYWDYTRENVLVTEFISGIPITNIAALKTHQMNMKKLAENGVEIFFTQVFRDSFFHADMHRGNIFIDASNRQNPRYLAVDFGIMGVLSPTDQRYIAENLLAFFKRDYRQVALLHVESGWVPKETRVEEFESAIRTVCEPIFEKPLSEISFGQLLVRLFQTASRFHMEVQPQLMLLQKTLLSIEGLGRQLYPDLDLWSTAQPFLEKWLQERIGVRALMSTTLEKAPFWAEKMTDMPDMVYKFLQMRSELGLPSRSFVTIPTRKRARFPLKTIGFVLIFVAGLNWFTLNETEHTRAVVEMSVAGMGMLLLLLGFAYR
ncbi:MAG: ubiquinone biosynthesis regulatory protein kinase UbiB, partial [Coxiellaceae bacterium]|nr:ubiquinone biosynthesis regulatory protein kinase UbiB [Coxiellaceae bacterium]